jgi:hypothetical protein
MLSLWSSGYGLLSGRHHLRASAIQLKGLWPLQGFGRNCHDVIQSRPESLIINVLEFPEKRCIELTARSSIVVRKSRVMERFGRQSRNRGLSATFL